MADPKPTKKIAIITGASSGIGAEFALQIERNYYLDEIWMIARRAGPMRELAEKFLKSKAVVLELDLTSKSDLAELARRIAEEKPQIEFLVNNAGFGKYGPFSELGLAEQIQMIDLNITALTYLSRVCVPFMMPGAHLVHVASAAAFSPSPYFAVYAATKSFVLSLSDAMGYELRDHGIHVMAVCPGPVETEFFTVAQKNEFMRDKVGEATPPSRRFAAASRDVVARALADLEKGRRRSIFGSSMRSFAFASRFLPLGMKLRTLARRNLSK